MRSSVYNQKVWDWHFYQGDGDVLSYNFYVGQLLVGQIFAGRSGNWSAVSNFPKDWAPTIFPVNGFATRTLAAEFLVAWADKDLKEVLR